MPRAIRFNLYPLDELSLTTGKTVVPVLASRGEIAKLIKAHLGVGSETIEGLLAQTDDRVELLDRIETDGSELSEMAQEASVVRAGQRNPARGDRIPRERRTR